MAKKLKPSTDADVARVLFALKQRNEQVYIPYLQGKIAALKAKIEQATNSQPENEA